MKQGIIVLACVLMLSEYSFPQTGGSSTFSFLDLPVSARVASLGGSLVPVYDNDLNLAWINPALLNESMNNNIALNYSRYFSDIWFGNISVARKLGKNTMFSAGVMDVDYGNFLATTETGSITGVFSAREYVAQLSCSQAIDSFFSAGVSLKFIGSNLEMYHSYGLAADIGLSYLNPTNMLSASLVLRNAGRQITTYYQNGEQEALPTEIQFGISKRLAHAPFRFDLVIDHLEKFDLSYDNPLDPSQAIDPVTGQKVGQSKIKELTDKALRHLILGVEFLPSKNLFFNISYNFKRSKELKVDTRPGFVGFSVGLGIKISKFSFCYSRSTYSLAGASNQFSFSTCLSDVYHKIMK
ncbi:MAG: type IX secretion system protein PorQ [Bacteroidia bacterium]|nr:type IX secretion system protein PorQ [Bacteroidia bacterium]